MSSITRSATDARVFQYSTWDSVLVALAVLHGVVLTTLPGVAVIGIGLWWNSNSISHNFIHNPFFRSRLLNRGFAAFLSVLLGFPQALWRSRHLAHHAGVKPKVCLSAELVVQTGLVLALWILLGMLNPIFLLSVYLPGWMLGMVLCSLQGHFEHSRGTVSCYGSIYNLLFFNDGLHVEHHAHPREHWTRLRRRNSNVEASRWPPVLRWLEVFSLEGLERFVLKSPWVQSFVLRCHERAFASLLDGCQNIQRVGIVGGGLFPRTALILRRLLPDAELVVIDLSQTSLEAASTLMPDGVTVLHEAWDPQRHNEFDALVIPLSLRGDREDVYRRPAARFVFVHDWIWNRRGEGRRVAWWLLKRLNLVRS